MAEIAPPSRAAELLDVDTPAGQVGLGLDVARWFIPGLAATVMPHFSSMTSPPPRVAARPLLLTRPGPCGALFGRPESFAALAGATCGDSVGILKIVADD